MSIGRSSQRNRLWPALLAAVGIGAAAQAQAQGLASASALAMPGGPVTVTAPRVNPSANVTLYVRLSDAPLAAVAGHKKLGMKMTADQQRAYAAQLRQKQAAVMAQVQALGGTQLASLVNASNALVVEIAASQAPVIAQLPGVAEVMPVRDYELDLANTVPYVGAAALQSLGVDGSGVRVAVLDSGVDFMHYNLGGTGSVDDYNTCYAQRDVAPSGICASYFGPSAPKVIGGYDFVGEDWPNAPLNPDPNPIARAVTGGHGTNVADIILGRSADGVRKGVAPGAKLYAVKVCSAVSSSCSGLAILQGFDFVLDPNGDGDLSDAVDVANLSLGASYGQRENPSVKAANTASQFGVVVVASAGNSANRPFITGSPSSATSVISVAQTAVPTAQTFPLVIHAPPAIAGTYTNTNTVDWAPVGSGFSNKTVKATTATPASPPTNDACNPLPAGSLSGVVALVRRGTCAVSIKVDNAANAGAIAVLIDNNAAGDPPTFSFGGGTNMVPTLIITQALGNAIRTQLAGGATVTASTGAPINLAGSMVATSSRGPNYGLGMIKPDIGAPGASLSAEVGTGNGQSVFGGTSGAAPMVAGGAALLLQAYPSLLPHEVKARLMNAAEINVYTNPAASPGVLAPITRIGAGELRVDRSFALKTAAWDASSPSAVSLSFGVTRNIGTQTLRKRVLVRNYSNVARTYSISRSFRYANDQASGAVSFSMPASISVPANGSATFIVTATVNANLLPNWQATGINGGANGGNAALLDGPEYDGYITIADATDTVRLPWHVLPHQAHNVAAPSSLALGGNPSVALNLTNTGGAVAGSVDVFYLTGTSPQLPRSALPAEGDSYTLTDLRAVGVRAVNIGSGQFGLQFAVNTWGARSHPNYPARISVFIDQDNDGTDDFEVWTQENGAFASTGQSVTFVRKICSTTGSGFFFTDADLASANAILTIPMVATTLSNAGCATPGANLALTPDSTFRFRVAVSDNYFTGAVTDSIPGMQVNMNNPRFFPTGFAHTVPINGTTPITINRFAPGDTLSPSQIGILLMTRDGRFGAEALPVTVTP
jgi:hypothetical protein